MGIKDEKTTLYLRDQFEKHGLISQMCANDLAAFIEAYNKISLLKSSEIRKMLLEKLETSHDEIINEISDR